MTHGGQSMKSRYMRYECDRVKKCLFNQDGMPNCICSIALLFMFKCFFLSDCGELGSQVHHPVFRSPEFVIESLKEMILAPEQCNRRGGGDLSPVSIVSCRGDSAGIVIGC
jgi:hypothetical protein